MGRIKTLVAMNVPVIDYSGSELVHPDLGVWMGRWARIARPHFPPDMLILKRMWEAALRGQARIAAESSDTDSIDMCIACRNTKHLDEAVHDCPICLFAWHASCSLRASSAAIDTSGVQKIQPGALPRVFRAERGSGLWHAGPNATR
jgi:hypothetical protein